ncbi:TetR/AcrR family transcriptional regulator [Geodermatophilus sp. YIM 151500]|uniref:TetR/AcrR family transcriptional regulator n=1 Tax=Geodermatophilus sp. YIM 151500 TaxID=2984531 RepID=UPI0021E389D2|nr:TetR/AcrR family transcriptional regulator [Geodermatophilus sp. YIM 151500]MCV2491842.1 TetR/AcrR family transcriptional regulator [Geodermatophilus sp. YIM 151500]
MDAGTLERPKRRREATAERLLDAALETFAEVGFAAASVEDVCRRGGFTRGAFYSSFRTKDELFAALFARESRRNLDRAQRQLEGVEREADPVTAAVDRCLAAFRADRTWVLVHTEYRLHAARTPEAAALLREHSAAVGHGLTALVEETSARAGLQLAVPAERLARAVMAVHDGAVLAQVTDGADDDLERTALLLLLRSAVAARSAG